jgi:hypothetical protein
MSEQTATVDGLPELPDPAFRFMGCGAMPHMAAIYSADQMREYARAALAASPAVQAVPTGYALVPIEPTPEMIKAGAEHITRNTDADPNEDAAQNFEFYRARGCAIAAYTDMLAAAPAAPIQPGDHQGTQA